MSDLYAVISALQDRIRETDPHAVMSADRPPGRLLYDAVVDYLVEYRSSQSIAESVVRDVLCAIPNDSMYKAEQCEESFRVAVVYVLEDVPDIEQWSTVQQRRSDADDEFLAQFGNELPRRVDKLAAFLPLQSPGETSRQVQYWGSVVGTNTKTWKMHSLPLRRAMGSIRRLAYGLTYGVINIPARWEYATRDAVHAAMIIKECAASESVQIEREDRLGYGLLQNVCESVMSEIEEVNTYMSGIDDAYDWVRDYREQVETWSYWIRVWNATELLGELLEDGVLHWPKGLIAETRSLSTFANR